jgi:hypothetical protein
MACAVFFISIPEVFDYSAFGVSPVAPLNKAVTVLLPVTEQPSVISVMSKYLLHILQKLSLAPHGCEHEQGGNAQQAAHDQSQQNPGRLFCQAVRLKPVELDHGFAEPLGFDV